MPSNSRNPGAPVCPKPLDTINWQELRRSKQYLHQLLEAHRTRGNGKRVGDCAAMLNLVDSLQEYAVNEQGRDYRLVWGR